LLTEKVRILDRLKEEAHQLDHIRSLVQENAPCICVLQEINITKMRLNSIYVDLLKYQLSACVDVMHRDRDPDTCTKELRKIVDLFGAITSL
jgi:DNA-binding FrmR family transcriptional regulator